MNELPCICCGRELESSDHKDEETVNIPYGGTVFITHGHYGSTVFDPMPFMVSSNQIEYLELNVCDPCLLERHDRVLRGVKTTRYERDCEPWTPEAELFTKNNENNEMS